MAAQHFRSNCEVFGNDSDLKTLPGYSPNDFAVPRQHINEMKNWRCMIGLKCKLRCCGCGQGFLPAQYFRSNCEVFWNNGDVNTFAD